jgi:beta-lactamase class A
MSGEVFLKVVAIPLTAIIFFAAGNLLAERSRAENESPEINFHQIREATSSLHYKFISPLLGCAISSQKEMRDFLPLRTKLEQLIAKKVGEKQAANISVYLDTRDGRWLSINTDEDYSPASMMKVPIMIALFKKAELDPKILQTKVLYDGKQNFNDDQYFKPQEVLVPGHYYTIEELVERMIVYSDNNTLPLLNPYVDVKKLREVFSDLGVFFPKQDDLASQDFISVQAYANFFRVLYNASYLNRDSSEKALELLSKVSFSQGITAGVPSATPIAQKFGERDFVNASASSGTSKELHDCGVVYVPDHPYLLCIMTKGTNFDTLAATIKDVSHVVYDEVYNGI